MQTNDFSKSIDRVLSGNYPRFDLVMVSKTPILIQKVGFADLPIMMTQKHITSCMSEFNADSHSHGLSKDLMLSLEEGISKPAFIFKSFKQKDRIIVVTNELDANKNPIIAILQSNGTGTFNGKYTRFNILNSVYGKENFNFFLNRAIHNNELMYYDKEKSRDLLRQVGNSYPKELTNHDSNIIIRYLNENVKPLPQNIFKSEKIVEQIDVKEQLVRQKLIELGKSRDVAALDSKLLIPLAEAQLEAELFREGKQQSHQEFNQSVATNETVKNNNETTKQKFNNEKEKKS